MKHKCVKQEWQLSQIMLQSPSDKVHKSEWLIKFNSLSWDGEHRGPHNSYKHVIITYTME